MVREQFLEEDIVETSRSTSRLNYRGEHLNGRQFVGYKCQSPRGLNNVQSAAVKPVAVTKSSVTLSGARNVSVSFVQHLFVRKRTAPNDKNGIGGKRLLDRDDRQSTIDVSTSAFTRTSREIVQFTEPWHYILWNSSFFYQGLVMESRFV